MDKRDIPGTSVRDRMRGVEGFVRELGSDVDTKAVRRLFDEEAPRAFRALVGRRGDEPHAPGFRQMLSTASAIFQGLTRRLSPGRRMLFLFAMVMPLFTILTADVAAGGGIDLSPGFCLLSIAALTALLALELVDRSRVRDELDVARSLQRDLLPKTVQAPPGWQIVHGYQTANEIGGDYHDFLPLPDGRLVIAVGDASGHGLAAGLLMAIGKATLEAAIDIDPSPAVVLTYLNRILFRTGGQRAFMTLFYGVLDPATGRLDYACAGHPFPLRRRADGRVDELGTGALPLGLRRQMSWNEATVVLDPGDVLVLYSDGIVEAVGGPGRNPLGYETLHRWVVAGGHPARVHENLWALLAAHHGDLALEDDATVVVIGRDPVAPKPNSVAVTPPLPALPPLPR
jgi:serine phosphatase RsbU (regulator of sigma subunit)